MKKIVLFVCAIVLTIACESDSNTVEAKLYTCLMNSLSQDEKEKVETIVSEYETYLINNGVLASSSAESYWKFYKEFAEGTLSDFKNEFNFSKKISFLNNKSSEELQGLMDCHYKIFETDEYKQSKSYKINKAMEKVNVAISSDPKIIAGKIIEYMTREDFENSYNRLNTLLFIEEHR